MRHLTLLPEVEVKQCECNPRVQINAPARAPPGTPWQAAALRRLVSVACFGTGRDVLMRARRWRDRRGLA